MATPNPSSDCLDSEQSHLKVNFMETLAGGDLPASHTVHKETKTPLKGYICQRHTTTFGEGCVIGSSVNNLPPVEEPEDTQTLGRRMDKKCDPEDHPTRVSTPSTDLEEDEDTDSDNEGAGADQMVTAKDQQINKNSTCRRLQIDPLDGWPEIQLVIPEPKEKHGNEDGNKEEKTEESESSDDECQEAYKQRENCESQHEGMQTESTEQEEKHTEKENNGESQSNEEEYAELPEEIQVNERPDATTLPDSNGDDGKQHSENHEKKEMQNSEEDQEPDAQRQHCDKADALLFRETAAEDFQLGSSCPPRPAQGPREEHHAREDLPVCKPREDTEVTHVPGMPATLQEDEPAEMPKTSTTESSPVSSGHSEDDDTRSDTQTTTCVNWSKAFRWLRRRVLACLGRRATGTSPPATPTKRSLHTSKEPTLKNPRRKHNLVPRG